MGNLPVRQRVRCWVDRSDGCLVLLLGSTREVMDYSVGHVGLLLDTCSTPEICRGEIAVVPLLEERDLSVTHSGR